MLLDAIRNPMATKVSFGLVVVRICPSMLPSSMQPGSLDQAQVEWGAERKRGPPSRSDEIDWRGYTDLDQIWQVNHLEHEYVNRTPASLGDYVRPLSCLCR